MQFHSPLNWKLLRPHIVFSRRVMLHIFVRLLSSFKHSIKNSANALHCQHCIVSVPEIRSGSPIRPSRCSLQHDPTQTTNQSPEQPSIHRSDQSASYPFTGSSFPSSGSSYSSLPSQRIVLFQWEFFLRRPAKLTNPLIPAHSGLMSQPNQRQLVVEHAALKPARTDGLEPMKGGT